MTANLTLTIAQIQNKIKQLNGLSAGVIYGFRANEQFDRIWYDQWGSSVISSYGGALEELGVQPFFIDVETFCKLAFNNQLPELVCTFNLNAGVTPITHWSMVPAVSAWFDIPSMPASADVLTVCERKDTAALIASDCGYSIATTHTRETLRLLPPDKPLIIKPRDLGGSIGIKITTAQELLAGKFLINPTDIVQEFIPGFDLTVPVVFQPSTNSYRCPAAVLYLPENNADENWWHSEETKFQGSGYKKTVIELDAQFELQMQHFADTCQLGPYARVDFRISAREPILVENNLNSLNCTFIEVNPLPTLRKGINFLNVVNSAVFRKCFETEFTAMEALLGNNISPHALVLACALCQLGKVRATRDVLSVQNQIE